MSKSGSLPDFSRHIALRGFISKLASFDRAGWNVPVLPATALFVGAFVRISGRSFVYVAGDKEEADEMILNLEEAARVPVYFLEPGYRVSGDTLAEDAFAVRSRQQTLSAVRQEQSPFLLVTTPLGFLEKIPSEEALEGRRFQIRVNEKVDPDFLSEWLFDLDFEKVDLVTAPGEFARSGAVLDIFSYSSGKPVRIFFDDETVAQIRYFDIETQLTERSLNQTEIVAKADQETEQIALHEIFPEHSVIYANSFDALSRLSEYLKTKDEKSLFDISFGIEHLERFTLVSPSFQDKLVFAPPVDKILMHYRDFNAFWEQAKKDFENGLQVFIGSGDQTQRKRLQTLIDARDDEFAPVLTDVTFTEAFRCHGLGFVYYPEHKIFNRPLPEKRDPHKRQKQQLLLRSYQHWSKGDYIVHTDYGIGIYEGLVTILKDGKRVEAVKLRFKNDDVLYVGVHALYKLAKYRSERGKPPRLHKLGSALWRRTKERTKKKIKKLAFDLLKLYAERKRREGFAFGPDSTMQMELESAFPYQETPDQEEAIKAVKKDMESPRPMDRLVCGDVGFGKTEVAVRAAFKAADNGKQTAVLVPTTILAYQHYRTFKERMKNFPVTVEYLNRFRSAAERQRILRELAEGKIDIIIGTHALAGDKVKFKDLGLLIIDEEQKFGVNVKEKIKNLKKNIDVLTLTATPIPRTLQFSLMGERDLSVINTPPPNRYPIDTIVTVFDQRILKEAIERELARGGQVFFVHNRVENINEVAAMVQSWVPEAKIAVAHGRTEGKRLEKIMLDFARGKYDVLVSTAIVESGLDVPNANTMIVHNAHQFGLADLHQLRGRVGRSNRKAYCYFVIPSHEGLTAEARKRMQTLEAYTALGSGFEIALRDLEIRGAGDLLGAEQSGYIDEMGFDTYQKIMQEAVEELRAELHLDDEEKPSKLSVYRVSWETDKEWFIPQEYVRSRTERLRLYQQFNEAATTDEIDRLLEMTEDRFGPAPAEVKELVSALRLRLLAAEAGLEKLIWKKGQFTVYASGVFYGDRPELVMKLLRFMREEYPGSTVRQSGEIMKLSFGQVLTLAELEQILKALRDAVLVG